LVDKAPDKGSTVGCHRLHPRRRNKRDAVQKTKIKKIKNKKTNKQQKNKKKKQMAVV